MKRTSEIIIKVLWFCFRLKCYEPYALCTKLMDMFKRVMREKFNPLQMGKDKSNEFAQFDMGSLTIDDF